MSLALGFACPQSQHCGFRPLGKGPLGVDLGLGLAPMRMQNRAKGCVVSGGVVLVEGAMQGEHGPKCFVAGAVECAGPRRALPVLPH